MAITPTEACRFTQDGFVLHANGELHDGLTTNAMVRPLRPVDTTHFDAIIVGAGFAGLIAARELSHRHRRVLMIEARDRIGGRTFTATCNNDKYEIGGAWVHWSQPHVWTEMTRYGLTITETIGASADRVNVLLDNGSRLERLSMKDLYPKICEMMDTYSNVDGVLGRSVIPMPHACLAANEKIAAYDHWSMQDRLDQISASFNNDPDLYQIMDSYLSMNSQGKLSEGGFIDHLHWWALGDYDTARLFDKSSRYKIKEGTSALAQAIFNDCRDVQLLLSTPVLSIDRTDENTVVIHTRDGQLFTARTALVTIPLNALHKIDFAPPLPLEKQRVINEGQCRGGSKFMVKLKRPVGEWCGFAPYPSPITMAFTDDAEGSVIIGFGADDLLDMRDMNAVQRELSKLLPDVLIDYVIGHDWRKDSFVGGTWSWYQPGRVSSNLLALQAHAPPVFFASSDYSNGWRGFIDGALESGLTTVRHIEQYLGKASTNN